MAGADQGIQDMQDLAAWVTAESLEKGRILFAGECRFIAGATTQDNLPPGTLPEVAIAGRSNVGKSSLEETVLANNLEAAEEVAVGG